MPSGDFSRPTGGRKPVKKVNKAPAGRRNTSPPPVTDVRSGGGYKIPKSVPPPPSWTRPVTPPSVQVPKRPAPKPVKVNNRVPTYAQSPRGVARQDRRRAAREWQTLRNARVAEQARIATGTFIGPLQPRVDLPDSHTPISPPSLLRDSGVANNPVPQVRGVVLSPQQIQRDLAAIMRPGPGKGRIVERLRAAGVGNAPLTGLERRELETVRRQDLEAQAWELQKQYNHASSDLSVPYGDFVGAIRRMSTGQLQDWVERASAPENLAKMGFDPSSLGGLIMGTSQGLSDAARSVTGSSLIGNAAHDVLMWPTWAVPAAYQAATRPGDFVKGLSQGVIGNAVRGDWQGVGRAFREHPVFSIAEVRGGQALAGRALAAPIRQATRGRVLGTQRVPINLTGLDASNAARLRSYSKEPLTQAVQRATDRALTRPGLDVRIAGRGRVPARVLKTDLPVVGRALEASRQHGVERLTDLNRAAGISLERSLREGAQHVANVARSESSVGRFLANLLDLPRRPANAEGYHGVLGKIAAKVAPDLATDPVPMLVSFVQRGVIRHHPDGPGSLPTAKSVADDLDNIIRQVTAEMQRPGAYRNLGELKAAEDMVAFLTGVRDSGRGITRAVSIAKRLVPEFKKNDSELVRLGALDAEAAARAPLFPAAMSRLGAEYGPGAVDQAAQFNRIAALEQAVAGARREERLAAGTKGRLEQATATRVALEKELAKARQTELPSALRRDGQTISNEQIRAELQAQGIDPSQIVHLPHQELGRGAYHKSQDTSGRRNADTNALTGAMWRRGASASSWDHVVDSLVHGRTLAANIQTLDQFVHDLGTKVGDGTWKETVRAAESEFQTRGGKLVLDAKGKPIPKYVAVRRVSSRLDQDRREAIAELQDVNENVPLTQRMLDDRLRPPEKDGPDVAVLVPVEAIKRAESHIKGGATIAELQAVSSAFRQTVLPFSTKWLTGNVMEAIIRTASVTVNPFDRRVARIALDRMIAEDALALHAGNAAVTAKARRLIELSQGLGRTAHPKQIRQLRQELIDYAPRARAAEAELTGGLLFGQRGQTVRRTAEEMGNLGRTVAFLGRAPVINEFAGMTRWLARKSFDINRVLEREAQYVALGKHVRNEIQEFTGRWQSGLRLYEQGIQDLSRGLLGTPAQLKAANWLDETLGRYSRFSPKVRQTIQTYTPFLPWYLNAVRWTMWTLPAKHPIKTGLLTLAERTFEQDWEQQHNDKLTRKGDLATAVQTKDGGWLNLARYTPFGLLGPALGGKDPGALADVVLPQISGATAAFRGQDPFGNPLVIPKKYGGTGEELDPWGIAAYQGLESMVPLVSIIRRLQEGGETALPTSTVWDPKTKPGSSYGQSALQRVFDPFRPIYLRAPQDQGGVRLPARVQQAIDKALDSDGAALPKHIQDKLDELLD